MYLLRDNPALVELIGVMEGWEAQGGLRKYILGGLKPYSMAPQRLLGIADIKQPAVTAALAKIKAQPPPHTLAWVIDTANMQISYVPA